MRFLKETYILFSMTAISALFSFITGIWIRNTLGPAEFGIWLIISMILTYGYYMNLGFLDGLTRDIPRLLGEKKDKQVQQVRNIVFTWMLASASLMVIFVIIMIMLPLSRFETILSILAILLVPLQNMTLFHNNLFLTIQRFHVVAVIQFLNGSLQYILMAIFALYMGVYGIFLGVFLGNIIAIFYSQFKLNYRLHLEWDWGIFKEMLAYGVPITLIGMLLTLLTSMDRFIVLVFFGPETLGLYGLVPLIFQGIMVLPNVFHQVMYPKISRYYGEVGEKRELKALFVNPSVYLSYLSPILLGLLYFIFPSFVKVFMPEYVWGITAAQIVLIGMFFYLWAALYTQYLTVVNKPWKYFKILIGAVMMNVIVSITLIHLGLRMEGVAVGTAITYILYPMTLMWVCFRDMGEKILEFCKTAVIVMIPYLTMLVFLLLINQLEFHWMGKMVLYVVLYLIFLVISSFRISILISQRRKLTGLLLQRGKKDHSLNEQNDKEIKK